jgi:hypothetical protein
MDDSRHIWQHQSRPADMLGRVQIAGLKFVLLQLAGPPGRSAGNASELFKSGGGYRGAGSELQLAPSTANGSPQWDGDPARRGQPGTHG